MMDADHRVFAEYASSCMPRLLVRLANLFAHEPDPMLAALALTQCTLSEAWTQRIHTLGETRFQNWVRKDISNRGTRLLIERARALGRKKAMGLDSEDWALITERDVHEAVAALDPRLRDLYRSHSDGSSYQFLAHGLGVGELTVGRLLAQARRELRERLTDVARARRGAMPPHPPPQPPLPPGAPTDRDTP